MSVKVLIKGGREDGKSTVANLVYTTLKELGYDVSIADGEETRLHKEGDFELPSLEDCVSSTGKVWDNRKVKIQVENK